MDSSISSRPLALNRAVQTYVDSMFGGQKFSNFLAHSFKGAYLSNKKLFIAKSKPCQNQIKAELLKDIPNHLKLMSVIEKLKQLDEYDLSSETHEPMIRNGKNGNCFKSYLLAIKEAYLCEQEKSVEAEYSLLKSELAERLQTFADMKIELTNTCNISVEDLEDVRKELEKFQNDFL